jgi:hypothetical protein
VFDGKSQILKRATELASQARVGATRSDRRLIAREVNHELLLVKHSDMC